MNVTVVIGQFLTFLSYLIYWISRFFKEKKNMLIFDNCSRIVTIISFIVLNSYDGIKNTIFVFFRNLFGQFFENKKLIYKIVIFIIMSIILIGVYYFNFNGISTVCVYLCGIINLYGVVMCKEQGIRICGLIGSPLYMLFMFFSTNYVGLVCEIICFIVVLISYLKYRKIKNG